MSQAGGCSAVAGLWRSKVHPPQRLSMWLAIADHVVRKNHSRYEEGDTGLVQASILRDYMLRQTRLYTVRALDLVQQRQWGRMGD
jgi:hypothetical protein